MCCVGGSEVRCGTAVTSIAEKPTVLGMYWQQAHHAVLYLVQSCCMSLVQDGKASGWVTRCEFVRDSFSFFLNGPAWWGMRHGTGMYGREGCCYGDCNTCAPQGVSAKHVQRRCGANKRCASVMEAKAMQWIAVNRRRSMTESEMRQIVSTPSCTNWERRNRCLSDTQGGSAHVPRLY